MGRALRQVGRGSLTQRGGALPWPPPMILAIDGPAASGKSTVARMLADRLGAWLLDSGAVYRAVALAALERGLDLDAGKQLGDLASSVRVEFRDTEDGVRVMLDGRDVSEAIRMPEVSEAASRISVHPEVRRALLDHQRRAAEGRRVVAEGRDMGTVVFPDADVKFFLTADERVRAERRWRELLARGRSVTLEEVLAEQRERDRRDRERAVAPLRPAEDAVVVDSTSMTPEQVVEKMMDVLRSRGIAEV